MAEAITSKDAALASLSVLKSAAELMLASRRRRLENLTRATRQLSRELQVCNNTADVVSMMQEIAEVR